MKPLGHQLKGLNCYAGATIMGDGKIALILDVTGLGLRAGVMSDSRQQSAGSAAPAAAATARADRTSLLLFRAGGFERLAMPLSAVARLEKIPRSRVEKAAGRAVLQYRGSILPLLSLGEMLGGGSDAVAELLKVVIYRSGETDFGLLLDEIVDIRRGKPGEPLGRGAPWIARVRGSGRQSHRFSGS